MVSFDLFALHFAGVIERFKTKEVLCVEVTLLEIPHLAIVLVKLLELLRLFGIDH